MKKNKKTSLMIDKKILLGSSKVRWAIFACFYAVVLLLNYFVDPKTTINVSTGDICPENIIAPIRIIDAEMTESLRAQAADMTSPVYDYIPAVLAAAQKNIESLKQIITGVHSEHINEDSASYYNNLCSTNLTLEQFSYLISLSGENKNLFIATLDKIASKLYEGEVKSTESEKTSEKIQEILKSGSLPEQSQQLALKVLSSIIAPNMVLNESATALARQAARDSVYEVVYEAGQTIINKGEIVSEHQIRLLKQNGLIKTGIFESLSSSVGEPGLLLALTGMFIYYIKIYHKDIYKSNKSLLMLITLFMLCVLSAQLCAPYSIYLVPIALQTLCASIIFHEKFAVQLNLLTVMFLSVTLSLDIDSVLYLLVSGYVGVAYTNKITRRSDLFKSAMFICAANIIMVMLLSLLRSNLTREIFTSCVYAIGSGIITAVASGAILMAYEEVFNIATPFILLEMSGANDVPMQNLVTNAPGTYYHSLLVGNMAEAACLEIGANALLAKVGAYYHDIGKAHKAMYYKENQGGAENPHDLITPDVSASIIKNHVSDGVYIASKYKIPEEIIEFIRTHHGTSEISYFKAKAEEEGYEGDEDFRYHGKLPKTKETSIVMLADSIEAASRAMDTHEVEKLTALIEKITVKKVREGQFADSRLSFEELERVKACFLQLLNNIYHSRIKYPEEKRIEEK